MTNSWPFKKEGISPVKSLGCPPCWECVCKECISKLPTHLLEISFGLRIFQKNFHPKEFSSKFTGYLCHCGYRSKAMKYWVLSVVVNSAKNVCLRNFGEANTCLFDTTHLLTVKSTNVNKSSIHEQGKFYENENWNLKEGIKLKTNDLNLYCAKLLF